MCTHNFHEVLVKIKSLKVIRIQTLTHRANEWSQNIFQIWAYDIGLKQAIFFQTRLLPSIKKDPVSKKSSDKSRLKKAA